MKKQWVFRSTVNGRYMYYTDARRGHHRSKTGELVTRVWDRFRGEELCSIDNVVPVEPGPGVTTMLLAFAGRGLARRAGSRLLHDAASGKSWLVTE